MQSQVLQKVFQLYAGNTLMRTKGYERLSEDPSRCELPPPSQPRQGELESDYGSCTAASALVFFRCLLNADPDDWDMLLYQGLKQDAVSVSSSLNFSLAGQRGCVSEERSGSYDARGDWQVTSPEAVVDEIGAMIQGVVLKLPEGSMTQRVQVNDVAATPDICVNACLISRFLIHPQAEYLRELMARVQRYQTRDTAF
jgi:hypothetical protein